MKRVSRASLAAALLIALVSAVAFPGSAQAASNCFSSGALACYYEHTNFGGARGTIPDADFSGRCYLNVFSISGISSLANNSINSQTWFRNADYSGPSVTVGRQAEKSSLGALNDNVRSWVGSCYAGTRLVAGAGGSVPSARP